MPAPDANIPDPCDEQPGGELRTELDGDILVTSTSVDLRCFVRGGQPPYSCSRYQGPGAGSVPLGVGPLDGDASQCVFIGGVNLEQGDVPGVYGFTVIVADAGGSSLEVPIAFQSEQACSTSSVSISPEPVVETTVAGAGKGWTIVADDVDGISAEGTCEPCFDLGVLTRSPLLVGAALGCEDSGDVCSDCGDDCFAGASCPGTFVATRPVVLKDHTPVRTDGPGWATIDMRASYSGNSFDPCGGKSWGCHVELLELASSARGR
jgi:hypothetical protein